MRKTLEKGTKVKVKQQTILGWKGIGKIEFDYGDIVIVSKESDPNSKVLVCREEISVERKNET